MNRNLIKIVLSIVMLCCLVGLSSPVMAKDYLYVPSNNNLHIVDCDTDTVVKTIPFNDYIVGAIPSPDGKRFYMNSWHSVYEVDTQSNQIVDSPRVLVGFKPGDDHAGYCRVGGQ